MAFSNPSDLTVVTVHTARRLSERWVSRRTEAGWLERCHHRSDDTGFTALGEQKKAERLRRLLTFILPLVLPWRAEGLQFEVCTGTPSRRNLRSLLLFGFLLAPPVGRALARETCPAMLMITSSPAAVLACHRQAGGSHNAKLTATTPHARRRRQPGAVLPLGGAVAAVAPMCANAGQFWRANGPTVWFGVYWGILLERRASQRVTAQSP